MSKGLNRAVRDIIGTDQISRDALKLIFIRVIAGYGTVSEWGLVRAIIHDHMELLRLSDQVLVRAGLLPNGAEDAVQNGRGADGEKSPEPKAAGVGDERQVGGCLPLPHIGSTS